MGILTLIVLAGVLATVFTLGAGIVSMAHGGPEDEANSNKLMTRRVVFQGFTVFIVFLALLSQFAL